MCSSSFFALKSQEDSAILDVRDMTTLQAIRDSVYVAMAAAKQIDEKKDSVVSLTCMEQEDQAAASNVIKGTSTSRRAKIVITSDRLLMVGVHVFWCDSYNALFC